MRISDWSSDVCSSDLPGDLGGEGLGEAVDGVQAGADGRAALGKLQQALGGGLQSFDAVGDLGGIAGEFLSEGERRRVHQMGAADLDDLLEGLGLGIEGGVQVTEGGHRLAEDMIDRK